MKFDLLKNTTTTLDIESINMQIDRDMRDLNSLISLHSLYNVKDNVDTEEFKIALDSFKDTLGIDVEGVSDIVNQIKTKFFGIVDGFKKLIATIKDKFTTFIDWLSDVDHEIHAKLKLVSERDYLFKENEKAETFKNFINLSSYAKDLNQSSFMEFIIGTGFISDRTENVMSAIFNYLNSDTAENNVLKKDTICNEIKSFLISNKISSDYYLKMYDLVNEAKKEIGNYKEYNVTYAVVTTDDNAQPTSHVKLVSFNNCHMKLLGEKGKLSTILTKTPKIKTYKDLDYKTANRIVLDNIKNIEKLIAWYGKNYKNIVKYVESTDKLIEKIEKDINKEIENYEDDEKKVVSYMSWIINENREAFTKDIESFKTVEKILKEILKVKE